MKKQLFVLGMASVFALTGCHGIKKVGFSEFCDEVNKLESVRVTQVTIRGKIEEDKINLKYEISDSVLNNALNAVSTALDSSYSANEKGAISLALTYKTPSAVTLAEDSKCEYYTGMGFKVTHEKDSIEWDSKGLLASYQSENSKLSFTWKKA